MGMAKCKDCTHYLTCRQGNSNPEYCGQFMDYKNTVEVVRCKDCKHWVPGDSFSGDSLDDMQRIGRCPIMRFGRREKDFCCDGERKDND